MSIKAVLDTSPHCPECAFKHLAAIQGIALARGRPFGVPVEWTAPVEEYRFKRDVTALRARFLTLESLLPEYRRNIPVAIALLSAIEPIWSDEAPAETIRGLRKALTAFLPYERDFTNPETWQEASGRVRKALENYTNAILNEPVKSPSYGRWASRQNQPTQKLWSLTAAFAHAEEFQRECPVSIQESIGYTCSFLDVIYKEDVRLKFMAACFDLMTNPEVPVTQEPAK